MRLKEKASIDQNLPHYSSESNKNESFSFFPLQIGSAVGLCQNTGTPNRSVRSSEVETAGCAM